MNYVKKVVFPLEILPVVALLSALFQLLVSLAVWLLMHLLVAGPPKLSVLYFPLILLPLALLTLGLSWFLASIGVFLRDVGQLTVMATTGLMFLSPIFYPLASLPPRYQQIIALNPMTPVVEQARMVLLWGQAPDYWTIAGQTAGAAALAWLGFAWFQKTRKGFADVL